MLEAGDVQLLRIALHFATYIFVLEDNIESGVVI